MVEPVATPRCPALSCRFPGPLRRFLLGSRRLFLAAEALGDRAQPPADAGRLGLGLLALPVGLRLRARVELAADQLDLRDLGAVAAAEPDAQQAGVAARPRRKARRQRVEQLADDLLVLEIVHQQPARVEGLAIRAASLGDGDEALDKRPQLLGARNRRGQMLVAKQGRRLVPQHRDAMLGDASQLSVRNSVSHKCSYAGARRSGRLRRLA